MGDVIFLSSEQKDALTSAGAGLLFYPLTGEYLVHRGSNKYEVMYKPYERPSSLTDWLKMDPSNRPQPQWGDSPIADAVKKNSEKLKQQIENMFLYGTPSPFIGKRADAIIIDDVETPKEKNVEIGGNQCHLCGEGLLYYDINRTFIKKHRAVESQKVYTCGTTVFETWKERDPELAYVTENRKRHIHVGGDCLDVTR